MEVSADELYEVKLSLFLSVELIYKLDESLYKPYDVNSPDILSVE